MYGADSFYMSHTKESQLIMVPERGAEESSASLFHKLTQNPHKRLNCWAHKAGGFECRNVYTPEDVYDCR